MGNLTFCECFITYIDNGIKKKYTAHLFLFPQLETKWQFYQPFVLSGARLLHPDPDIKAHEYHLYIRRIGFNIDKDIYNSIKLHRTPCFHQIHRETACYY